MNIPSTSSQASRTQESSPSLCLAAYRVLSKSEGKVPVMNMCHKVLAIRKFI